MRAIQNTCFVPFKFGHEIDSVVSAEQSEKVQQRNLISEKRT